MMNLSDNLTHLLQLALLIIAGCVLILYAPSIPAVAVFSALMPAVTFLLGAKTNQIATNSASSNAAAVVSASVPVAVPAAGAQPELTPLSPPLSVEG